MKKSKPVILSGMVIVAILALMACNPIENDTQSANLLTVLSIQGVDSTGSGADFLQSDVVNMSTGSAVVTPDVATAAIRNTTLDPNPVGGVSQYSDVILTRYVVSYTLPNGAKTEGVDVPYSFEGALSTTIPINTEASFGFIVVRDVAKTEPPLRQLWDGVDVLQVTAKIEFFGHDVTNRDVKATGYLTIFFSNYAD